MSHYLYYRMQSPNSALSPQQQQISQIFNQNSVDDLQTFLCQRHCLNRFNISLVYLFYIVQSTGIIITSVATNYNNTNLAYVGIGLNLLASIINVFEKVNNGLLKTMMDNIQAIKDNHYVDEGALVDLESINPQQPPTTTPAPQPTMNPVQNQINIVPPQIE